MEIVSEEQDFAELYELEVEVMNDSPDLLVVGETYIFEQWIEEEWQQVDMDIEVRNIGHEIAPGESMVFAHSFHPTDGVREYESGEYRIRKEFFREEDMPIESIEDRYEVEAGFVIED